MQRIEYCDETALKLEVVRKLIGDTEKWMSTAPEGSLNIKKCKGYPQYFQYMKGNPSRRRYLGAEEEELKKELAQKDYNLMLLKVLKSEEKALKYCQEHYPQNSIDSVYEKLSPPRKKLVKPIRLTDARYIKSWEEMPYNGKGFSEDAVEDLYTKKDERVRSKSELLIADILYDAGIPYRYECPLQLLGKREYVTVYPDFTLLDIRTRREVYLEHFGMMSNSEYVADFMNKMSLYNANGIFQGDNLIMTFESSEVRLNTRAVKEMITRFFGQSGR